MPKTSETTTSTTTHFEDAPHSVEVSQNAKGQYSFSVKLYFSEEDRDNVVGKVEEIFDRLHVTFPNE